MTIRLVFAWYDFWVGLYWDRRKRRLYVFPVPCFGLVVESAKKGGEQRERHQASELGFSSDAAAYRMLLSCADRFKGAEPGSPEHIRAREAVWALLMELKVTNAS